MSQESEKVKGKTFFALIPEDQSKIDQGLTILARIIARDILRKRHAKAMEEYKCKI